MRRPLIFVFYALTGAFGLTYEVVWSRYLALMVGNTAYAHAVVLATFMGGLALGAWLFGGIADRARHGLKLYGWLEVAIGLYGVFFPQIFEFWRGVLVPVASAAGPGTTTSALIKLLVAALCVLPPTILMGGTLPILTRYLANSTAGLRESVSRLYALNAAGAVVGGLLAGFVFIAELGLPLTVTAAGLGNAVLGLLAVALGLSFPERRLGAQTTDGDADGDEYDGRARRTALWLAGFSGFATMALEVAWIRYFGLMLGSSTYAFTLMLAAFITGIALGAWWLSRPRAGRLPLMPLLAGALLITAGFLAASMVAYDRLPYMLAQLRRAFATSVEAWPYYQTSVYLTCFLFMALPTMVAGVVFPATVRVATEQGKMGGRLGRIYAVNTVGTLLGAILTGLVFFAWFGLENVLRGVLVAYALAALAVAWRHLTGRPRAVIISLSVAIAGGHLLLYTPADPRMLNLGLYRRQVDLSNGFQDFARRNIRDTLLFVGEGPHASVTVREVGRSTLIDGPLRVLTVNGKPDASTGVDMTPQLLIGHLPILLHPDPKTVFVLGLGSGVTAGAVSTHDVELDITEISPQVVAAERFFEPFNNAPLRHPKARLFVDDARTVLLYQDRQYDVVISEPTNPWQAGVAGLFTVEFFDEVKTRLRPGGVFGQWMHSYETDDAAMRMVIASLQSRFAYVVVIEMGEADYLFVASDVPFELDPEAFAARVARPRVKADLDRIGLSHPFALLALQVKASDRLRSEVEGELNTDMHPLLEFRAPRWFFAETKSTLLERIDDHRHLAGTLLVDAWTARFPVDAAAVDGLYRATAPFPLTRSRRAALLRLARAHWPADDRRIAKLERDTLLHHPEDADAHLPLRAFPLAPEMRPALRAQFERAILGYEGRFHRWAPPSAVPLERLIERFTLAAEGDAGWTARAVRYRLRLLQSVCTRDPDACARQSAWFEARAEGARWRDAWRTALLSAAILRHDVPAAVALVGRLPKGPTRDRWLNRIERLYRLKVESGPDKVPAPQAQEPR